MQFNRTRCPSPRVHCSFYRAFRSVAHGMMCAVLVQAKTVQDRMRDPERSRWYGRELSSPADGRAYVPPLADRGRGTTDRHSDAAQVTCSGTESGRPRPSAACPAHEPVRVARRTAYSALRPSCPSATRAGRSRSAYYLRSVAWSVRRHPTATVPAA